jgi:hypothetical protein
MILVLLVVVIPNLVYGLMTIRLTGDIYFTASRFYERIFSSLRVGGALNFAPSPDSYFALLF